MTGDELLRPGDIASQFQVPKPTVYYLLRTGRLPGFKIGGRWRIRVCDFAMWMSQQFEMSRFSADDDRVTRAVSDDERMGRLADNVKLEMLRARMKLLYRDLREMSGSEKLAEDISEFAGSLDALGRCERTT